MQFDYCSDLHLEFWEHPYTGEVPEPADILTNQQSDNLIIAGDLCVLNPISENSKRYFDVLEKFYQYISSNWSNIYFVLGNHDHWGCHFSQAYKLYQDLMPKVNVLSIHDKYFVETDQCIIAGDTFWTDLSIDKTVQFYMNDYRYIINDGDTTKSINWEVTTNHFKSAKEKLFRVSYDNPNKSIVMITHHCPSYESTELIDPNSPAYASKLDDQIELHPNIKVWVHGHVHQFQDYKIGDTRILCNPRGYFGMQRNAERCTLKQFQV